MDRAAEKLGAGILMLAPVIMADSSLRRGCWLLPLVFSHTEAPRRFTR